MVASYLAITAILGIIVCGRIDHAILLERRDGSALRVFSLAACLAVLISFILTVVFTFGRAEIAIALKNEKLADWLIFVPGSVFLIGMTQALIHWFNREGKFKLISLSRVGQTSVTAFINVILGFWLPLQGGAMIIGALAGQSIAFILLVWPFLRGRVLLKIGLDQRNSIYLTKYRNFPLFTLPADLINSITMYLPIFILGVMFGPEVVGLYMLTQRVVVMPVSMLGSAIAEAYKKEFLSGRSNPEKCFILYKKTLLWSIATGLPALLLFYLIAPWLFLLVFGEEWNEAGRMAQILATLYFMKFLASPLSYVFYVQSKQKEDFVLHVIMLIMSVLGLLLPYFMFQSLEYVLMGYVSSISSIYLYYIIRAGFLSNLKPPVFFVG